MRAAMRRVCAGGVLSTAAHRGSPPRERHRRCIVFMRAVWQPYPRIARAHARRHKGAQGSWRCCVGKWCGARAVSRRSEYAQLPTCAMQQIFRRARKTKAARSADTAPRVTSPATSRYGATVARVVSATRTRPPHMFAHMTRAWRNARVHGRGGIGAEVGVASAECNFTRHFNRDCDHLAVDANVKFYISVDAP